MRLFLYGFFIFTALGLFLFVNNSSSDTPRQQEGSTVHIADKIVRVEIVDTAEEREKGLSGHASLVEDEGMLFVFPESGRHAFWMKDMGFSIDIIWISESKEIVHIERNVSPESYPAIFTPRDESLYVLEVPAGFVEENSVRIGDTVIL